VEVEYAAEMSLLGDLAAVGLDRAGEFRAAVEPVV
jgi:hypothetical protein